MREALNYVMNANMTKHKATSREKTLFVQTRYGAHMCEFIADSEGKGYTVVARHLSGVVTQGRTLSEAKRMAREAIELCVECLTEERIARRRYRIARVPVASPRA